MDIEDQELGPYEPVPDSLILAAIERAEHHGTADVWIVEIGHHLGFRHDSRTTHQLRERLERLRGGKVVIETTHNGREHWALTEEGRKQLARSRHAAALMDLPESPQHRRWREARLQAVLRIDGFHAAALEAISTAESRLGWSRLPNSTTLFELSERLQQTLWCLGSATYCLYEWPEPDDAHVDIDPNPGPPPGRRAISAWNHQDSPLKGDSSS
ncbi:MAG: hypothetical protein ABW065_02895 [Solirubrobacterales bacterium]